MASTAIYSVFLFLAVALAPRPVASQCGGETYLQTLQTFPVQFLHLMLTSNDSLIYAAAGTNGVVGMLAGSSTSRFTVVDPRDCPSASHVWADPVNPTQVFVSCGAGGAISFSNTRAPNMLLSAVSTSSIVYDPITRLLLTVQDQVGIAGFNGTQPIQTTQAVGSSLAQIFIVNNMLLALYVPQGLFSIRMDSLGKPAWTSVSFPDACGGMYPVVVQPLFNGGMLIGCVNTGPGVAIAYIPAMTATTSIPVAQQTICFQAAVMDAANDPITGALVVVAICSSSLPGFSLSIEFMNVTSTSPTFRTLVPLIMCSQQSTIIRDPTLSSITYVACADASSSYGGLLRINSTGSNPEISSLVPVAACPSASSLLLQSNILYAVCSGSFLAVNLTTVDFAFKIISAGRGSPFPANSIARDLFTGVLWIASSAGLVQLDPNAPIDRFPTSGNCSIRAVVGRDAASGRITAVCQADGSLITLTNGLLPQSPPQPLVSSVPCSTVLAVATSSSGGAFLSCNNSVLFALQNNSATILPLSDACTPSVGLHIWRNTLFVGCGADSTTESIFALQLSTMQRLTMSSSSQCLAPRGLLFRYDSFSSSLYAGCSSGTSASTNVLQVSGRVLTSIAVCDDAAAMISSPDGSGRMLVGCASAGVIAVNAMPSVSSTSTTLIRSSLCTQPVAITSMRNSKRVAVACGSSSESLGSVVSFDPTGFANETYGVRQEISSTVCTQANGVVSANIGLIVSCTDKSARRLLLAPNIVLLSSALCPSPTNLVLDAALQSIFCICTQSFIQLNVQQTGNTPSKLYVSSRGGYGVPQTFAYDSGQRRAFLVACDSFSATTCSNTATIFVIYVSGIIPAGQRSSFPVPPTVMGPTDSTGLYFNPRSVVYYKDRLFFSGRESAMWVADPATGAFTTFSSTLVSVSAILVDPVSGLGVVSSSSGVTAITETFACHAGAAWYRGGCVQCPAQTYRGPLDVTPFSPCLPCPVGSIAPSAGSTSCTACDYGSYAATNGACSLCQPGAYQNETGKIGCKQCEPGYASSKVGASSCNQCMAGTYSPAEGGLSCALCDIGYAQSRAGATSCDACVPGRFAGLTGSTECDQCPPGSFSDSHNVTACTLCQPGEAQDGMGMTSCSPCNPGSFTSMSGSSKCNPCAVGSAFNSTGAVSCNICLPGSVQPAPGATECKPCDPGYFSIKAGGTECSPCIAGYYAIDQGTASCLACSPGRASSVVGLTSACPGCPAGQYQGGEGKTTCWVCEPQTYAQQPNSTSCTRCNAQVNLERTSCNTIACPKNYQYDDLVGCEPCPLGSMSSAGARCNVCPVQSYTPAVGYDCQSCLQPGMDGLDCKSGLAFVKAGWWAFLAPTQISANESAMMYRTVECPQTYCQGSPLQLTANSSTTYGDLRPYCEYPRVNSLTNTFCAQCEDNYIAWGSSCVQCSEANAGLFVAGVILSLVLVLFLLRSSASAAGAQAVFLFFIQIAALELIAVARWLDWLQLFNLDAHSTQACLAPWTPPQQTLFSLFMPIILLAELALIGAVHLCLERCSQENRVDQDEGISLASQPSSCLPPVSLDRYIAASVSILLFCFTQVATAAFQFLYCVDVGTQSLLFAAPTVDCQSSEYHKYLIPVALALTLYITGFPVVMALLLWKNKALLFVDESSAADLTPAVASFLTRYAPIYRAYQPSAWFWQPLLLLRRAAFAVTSVLLQQHASQRFMVYNLLHFASLLLHLFAQPFHSAALNRLDAVSYVLLSVLSIMLTSYTPPYPLAVQVLAFLLVIPAALVLLVAVIQEHWEEIESRLKRRKSSKKKQPAIPNSSEAIVSVHELTEAQVAEMATYEKSDVELESIGPDVRQVVPLTRDPLVDAASISSEQETL